MIVVLLMHQIISSNITPHKPVPPGPGLLWYLPFSDTATDFPFDFCCTLMLKSGSFVATFKSKSTVIFRMNSRSEVVHDRNEGSQGKLFLFLLAAG